MMIDLYFTVNNFNNLEKTNVATMEKFYVRHKQQQQQKISEMNTFVWHLKQNGKIWKLRHSFCPSTAIVRPNK